VSDPASVPPDLGALSEWAPELARTFVTLAGDIALVIDAEGIIRNVAQGCGEPIAPIAHQWVGRQWIDTVCGNTRPKIANLLKEVAATGLARRREVNHPQQSGVSVPVAYTAVRLGAHGPVLAVGRDLRAIAAIQQRFIDTQQDMERGYWQARQAESRYRLLFQVATDAVMVVDAHTLQIVEANHAAAEMFDIPAEHLAGRHASLGFERHSRSAVNELLNTARSSGQAGEIRARLLGTIKTTSVAATSFRADKAMRLLVRVRGVDAGATNASLGTLARLVDDSRDGVVVTDSSGRILVANPAFVSLVNLKSEAEAKGRELIDWLGLADRSLATLVPQVRREGIARRIESWVQPAGGAAVPVEISASLLTEGDRECIGFTIKPGAPQTAPGDSALSDALRVGIERLGTQLGRLELTELLQQAGAVAERHFLQLAVQRTGGDLDAAAALLGMSRQSLERRRAGGPDHLLGSPGTNTDAP
jgi:transcriptional regulator PpsR